MLIAFSLAGHSHYSNQAWRLPFLLSFILGLVGLYLRNQSAESPVFRELANHDKVLKVPLKDLLVKYYKQVIFAFCMMTAGSGSAYYTVIYYPAYISQMFNSLGQYLHVAMIGLIVLMILVPCFCY